MIFDGWIAIAAFALFVYVALDGYDLGIGVLMVGQRDTAQRREWARLVNTTCDGNESWFLLVAALLLAGVPGAYKVLLPTLYVPLTVMVVSLIARKVAAVRMTSRPGVADRCALVFAVGSFTAAFAQGVALTAIVEMLSHAGVASSRIGALDFLSWYSLLGGLTAVAVYAVAGAIWAAYKADAAVQRQARRTGALSVPVAAGLVALSAGLLPLSPNRLSAHWDGRLTLVGCAVLVGSMLGAVWGTQRRGAWLVAVTIVVAEVLTLGVICSMRLAATLPRHVHAQIAAPRSALYFVLIGVAPCMPLVLFLNGYALLNFRRRLLPGSVDNAAESVVGSKLPHVRYVVTDPRAVAIERADRASASRVDIRGAVRNSALTAS